MIKLLTTLLYCAGLLWSLSAAAHESINGKTIVVGYEADAQPYVFTNAQGEPDGFSIGLIRAIAEQQGLHIEFREAPWKETRSALERGEIDAVTTMSYSEQRAKTVEFSVPYQKDEIALFERKDSAAVASIDDLQGKRVLVQRSDIAHDYLLANAAGAELVLVEDWAEVLSQLAAGKAEYAMISSLAGRYFINQLQLSGLKRVTLANPSLTIRYAFAVKQEDQALLAQLNEGMTRIRGSGEFDRLYQQWFGELTPKSYAWTDILQVMAWVLGGAVIVLAVILGWTLSLKRLVNSRTSALQKQQELTRMLLENLAEGVVACDAGGKLTLFNRVARQWHGSDLPGIGPDQWARHYELYEADGITPLTTEKVPLLRALKGERVVNQEICIVRKGYPPRFLVASGGPLVGADGQKLGAVVTHHDDTENRRNMQRFAELFEFAPDAMVITNRKGLIEQVNQRSESLFGWERGELVGRPIEMLMPQYDEQKHRRCNEDSAAQTVVAISDVGEESRAYGIRKDGSSFPVEISLGSLESKEQVLNLVNVRDISDRLQQEEDRRALLVAERANAAKSAFLANMSHEIRTPMNGVIGCVDLLARSSLDADQAELVEVMQDSSLALLGVINDILDFSRIEADQLALEREPLSLERLVESVCATMRRIAWRKGITMDLFTDPQLPQLILSDSVRLRQILSNLLSNALKFTSDNDGDGRILVRVELMGDSQLQLKVADNGIGISAESQARIFQPFEQAESSTTRRYGGSGLGLAICKKLVDMLGGRLELDSVPGCGSTFRVNLPIEAHASVLPSHEPDLEGLHCLVVARDMTQARDWCGYLEHAGAQTEALAERAMLQSRLEQLAPHTRMVVLEEVTETALQWLDALDVEPKPALLVVDRGQRYKPRILVKGIAMLDGDAMPRQAFLLAVAMSCGRIQQPPLTALGEQLSQAMTPPDRANGIEAQRLILVAEDNDVNQKIIVRQLELLGHSAHVVSNGHDAFNAWQQGCYSLLLTDMHMPEMDGCDLARAIRNEEDGAAHLPILALTANAFREAAEQCLAAGMDGYLTKPIVLEQLKASLDKWLPEAAIRAPAAIDAGTSHNAEIIDKSVLDTTALTRLIGSEPALINEFLVNFYHSAEQAGAQLGSALAAGEWQMVRDVAHRLKSSSRAVGALTLGDSCEQIELAGSDDVDTLHRGFELALNAVLGEINKIKQRA